MLVIADSSALVALSICDSLQLLDSLFGEVTVPQAVYDEVCIANKPESQTLKSYLSGKVSNAQPSISIEKSAGLGKGELASMILYKHLSADLLQAKKQGLVDSVQPLFYRLRNSDIYVSHRLLDQVLVMAGELES
jgi:predicted nucleic acid-binding protein